MNPTSQLKKAISPPGLSNRRAFNTFLACLATAYFMVTGTTLSFFRPEVPANVSKRTLSFAERVAYQRAIEGVYWRHRIWPKDRPDPKPSLDAVISQAQVEKKVENYLRNSRALDDYWQRPIGREELQAEMDRMAKHTKQLEVLREIFQALGNDPFVIAECLVRPVLTERLTADLLAQAKTMRFESAALTKGLHRTSIATALGNWAYTLPRIPGGDPPCTDDTWTATSTINAPEARGLHTAVWTGSEMIVWGGGGATGNLNTGGRYNPSTDSWTATSTIKAPSARYGHTAVWTGSEMIVWGGNFSTAGNLNTGGRYNPATDSWLATSTSNAADPRGLHTAVWTGSEMIVWGGINGISFLPAATFLNTGGRYNPTTDSWTATSPSNAPGARAAHTAVWTGSEMIVWGGVVLGGLDNTGGRYDPATDTWIATSTSNPPDGRFYHTAVWTGSQMIVWGGTDNSSYFNTGGRYNPGTDSWTGTSTINAPDGRDLHTAVWTSSEMIVWGGSPDGGFSYLNTGGRYNSGTDSWTPTSTTNAPTARDYDTAIWTASEMIVWGGFDGNNDLNTGGRYCAAAPSPTPTPTPTSTPRPAPTPRPRPSPAPRP